MNPIRRFFLLLVPLALLLSVGAAAVTDGEPDAARAAETKTETAGGALLPRVQTYDDRFDDVAADSWYRGCVAAGFEYALFNGRGERAFVPDAAITVAELAILSARIRAAYEGDAIADTQPWSVAPYVAYLRAQGILDETLAASLDDRATRAQVAGVFAATLPEDCFDDRNAELVADARASGAFIRDVDEATPYQAKILWMYRQGLLTGVDERGSYLPAQTTTRAEVAAVVTRIVDPALRLTPPWDVQPRWSAAGKTLADLVAMPESVTDAPAYDDAAAIDALVRRMLALDERVITLDYPVGLSRSDVNTIVNLFNEFVNGYCEQMYNHVTTTSFIKNGQKTGHATVAFSAAGCTDEELTRYREQTMARAVEVHDSLWETGQLAEGMSQREVAEVYFRWLCENCAYDHAGAGDTSLSHIAYSALIGGKAVCDGYTGAYNLFLKLEGIDCRAVHNDSHIWTAATLDGTECHIDATWGDQPDGADMAFFAMTPEESYQYHPW